MEASAANYWRRDPHRARERWSNVLLMFAGANLHSASCTSASPFLWACAEGSSGVISPLVHSRPALFKDFPERGGQSGR